MDKLSYREGFGLQLPPAKTKVVVKHDPVMNFYIHWPDCPDGEDILYGWIAKRADIDKIIKKHKWEEIKEVKTKKSIPFLMETSNDKIKELRSLIKAQLEMCDHANTPTVCKMKSTTEGYNSVEEMIIRRVAEQGDTIGQAIIEIEKEFNLDEQSD